MSLLVGFVVANTANPAWREEMDVYCHFRIAGLDAVADAFCLLTVCPGITSGKGLHAIACRPIGGAGLLLLVLRIGEVRLVGRGRGTSGITSASSTSSSSRTSIKALSLHRGFRARGGPAC